MTTKEFPHFVPTPPAVEIFAVYQLTHEFRREVQRREEFDNYCQWYQETAKRHQQEFEKMRGDINLFSWLSWKKK